MLEILQPSLYLSNLTIWSLHHDLLASQVQEFFYHYEDPQNFLRYHWVAKSAKLSDSTSEVLELRFRFASGGFATLRWLAI